MRLLAFTLAVTMTFSAYGSECADSVKVRFAIGQRHFDPSISDNREAMDSFVGKVKEAAASGGIDSIIVYGYASPDGKPGANERLARNRCATIAEYIVTRTGVNRNLVEERPGGIGWDELRSLVAASPDVPNRQEVLDILDNTPVWIYDAGGRIVDGRKKRLMDLAGGRPYNWMYVNIFPELRNAVSIYIVAPPHSGK